MAKNQNTFAKKQREVEKKRKAEQKRLRRMERKAAAANPPADPEPADDETEDSLEVNASPVD